MQLATAAAADPQAHWDAMQLQIAQSMLEHEIVAQQLRAQTIVSAAFVLILGLLAFFLWKRHGDLHDAFLAEIKRHSAERVSMVKDHSLQLVSVQMQMLHSFENMASPRHSGLGSSHHSGAGSRHTPKPGGAG